MRHVLRYNREELSALAPVAAVQEQAGAHRGRSVGFAVSAEHESRKRGKEQDVCAIGYVRACADERSGGLAWDSGVAPDVLQTCSSVGGLSGAPLRTGAG